MPTQLLISQPRLFHFYVKYSFPSAPSVLFSWVVSGKSPSIVLSLSPPKIVLHPSISLPSHTLSHLSHSLPSAFRFCLLFGPHDNCIWIPPPLHAVFLFAPSPPSFPPANCWSILAIFGVLLPSSSSSCHSFIKKSSKLCSVCYCMVIDAQEEPRIRKSQCVSMWRVWESL